MFKKGQNSIITSVILPLIGGALFASSFPSKLVPSYFASGIIGIIILVYSMHLESPLTTFKNTLFKISTFSLGFTLLGYYWIPQTIQIFGSLPMSASIVIGLLFTLISLLQWPVALAAFFIIKHYLISSVNFKKSQYITLLFAILLTISELITPQQFPTHLGHIWLHLSPYLFWSPIVGEIGYSFISYWLILSLVSAVRQQYMPLLPILIGVVFTSLSFLIPLQNNFKNHQGTSINLRMVQANIGSLMKVGAERGAVSSFQTVYDRYEKLSLRPSKNKIDLIIWPETAYPETLYSNLIHKQKLTPPLIKKIIQINNTPILTGGYDLTVTRGQQSDGEFNTAFLFNQTGVLQQLYHKRKLIPFGEGLPFGPLNHILKKVITNISYFSAGTKFTNFKLKNDIHFITPICYEILFSSFISDYLNTLKVMPNFILNLTNDSWYGDTSEPYQHLFLAKWRALEFQLPLVRMTNTGITSITYPDGSESRRLLPYQQDVLDINLPIIKSTPTFYQIFGSYTLVALWIVIFIMHLIGHAISRKFRI